jgi:hypothetical protein
VADDLGELRQNVLDLTRAFAYAQNHLIALICYVFEEPNFDLGRYRAHFERVRKGLPYESQTDAALSRKLQAFLKDFEGPPQ